MIDIQLQDAFVLVTALFLGGLLVLWAYDSWRDRHRRWDAAEDQLGECSRCRMVFLVGSHENVVRCPRCKSLCQSRRRTGLSGR